MNANQYEQTGFQNALFLASQGNIKAMAIHMKISKLIKNTLILILPLMFFYNLCLASDKLSPYQNEPDGFRGYKWGISYEEAVKLKGDSNFQIYSVNRDDKGRSYKAYNYFDGYQYIEGEMITDIIQFYFLDNHLYNVFVPLAIKDDAKATQEKYFRIKESMIKYFGKPTEDSKIFDKRGKQIKGVESVIWKGPKSTINLSCILNMEKNLVFNLGIDICHTPTSELLSKEALQRHTDELKKGW